MSHQRSKTRVDMTEGPIVTKLAALAWPLVAGNLLQTFYNLADMFWVGRVGVNAVAAVSIVFPTSWVFVSIGMGLTVAAGALVAQYVGANPDQEAEHVAGQAVVSAVVLGGDRLPVSYSRRPAGLCLRTGYHPLLCG